MQAGDLIFIFRHMVFFAVEHKSPIRNAVGIAPNKHALIIRMVQMPFQGIETDQNICKYTVLIRHIQLIERAAVG